MSAKISKPMSIVLMVAMLFSLGTGAVFAQDATLNPGDGPGMALQPASGTVTIAPNSWQWYIFRSQVPVNVDADGNDVVTNPEDATIDATLRMISGNVDFEVWSDENLNNWNNSSDFDPMGTGTENEFITGDPLFWQGSFPTNDNYYLIVQNKSNQAATYTLDITGHLRFPTELSLDSMTPSMMLDPVQDQMPVLDQMIDVTAQVEEPVMSTGEMALTVEMPAETTVGTGPESTLMPTDGYVMIAPNSWQWYSFRSQVPVNVDADGEDVVTNPEDATINALLRTRSGNVDFEVWSADDLNNWMNSSDFDPMGACTINEFISGDPLFWQGSFPRNSLYYLIVMNQSSEPSYYSLDVSGHVSFPSANSLPVQ